MEPRDHVLEHKENIRPRGGGLRRNRAFTSLAGLLVVPVALQRSTKTRSTRPGRLGCRPRRLRTTEFALSSDIALPPHSDRLLGVRHPRVSESGSLSVASLRFGCVAARTQFSRAESVEQPWLRAGVGSSRKRRRNTADLR